MAKIKVNSKLSFSVIAFCLVFGLLPADCGQKKAAAANENQNKPPAKNVPASVPQVTFYELGSVNCIPCRMMQPVMKEIETAYAGRVKVIFIDVWTDEGRPAMEQFGIRAIPTQVFQDAQGTEFARHTGFYPKDSIVALLANKGVK
jgi:thioredoxin 1